MIINNNTTGCRCPLPHLLIRWEVHIRLFHLLAHLSPSSSSVAFFTSSLPRRHIGRSNPLGTSSRSLKWIKFYVTYLSLGIPALLRAPFSRIQEINRFLRNRWWKWKALGEDFYGPGRIPNVPGAICKALPNVFQLSLAGWEPNSLAVDGDFPLKLRAKRLGAS